MRFLDLEIADGLSLWKERGRDLDPLREVLIRQDLPPDRQRFVCAHEIAHHVLFFADWVEGLRFWGPNTHSSRQIEVICDFFAACVLVAQRWITPAQLDSPSALLRLAATLEVPLEAVLLRLHHAPERPGIRAAWVARGNEECADSGRWSVIARSRLVLNEPVLRLASSNAASMTALQTGERIALDGLDESGRQSERWVFTPVERGRSWLGMRESP